MATYPCSKCGAVADTHTGCPKCGSTLDQEISELNRTILSMQQRNKAMVDDRTALMARLQGAIAIRSLLMHARDVERGPAGGKGRLGRVVGGTGKPMAMPVGPRRRWRRSRSEAAATVPQQAAAAEGETVAALAATPEPVASEPGADADTAATASAATVGSTGTATDTDSVAPHPTGPRRAGGPVGTTTRQGPRRSGPPRQSRSGGAATPPPPPPPGGGHHGGDPHAHHPPETTRRSMQNLVLALGAIVAVGAIGLIPYFYSGLGSQARWTSLTVLTAVGVTLPLVLGRRGLITTAEWLTPIPLMFLLLDGWALWHAQIHGLLPWFVYAGLVFAVAAGAAAVLAALTDLAVPRFSSILLIQPIPALVLYHYLHDAAAWAAVLTATAAVDLVIADSSHKQHTHGRYLKFAIRRLQELVNLGGLVYGTIALVNASDATSSFRAGATVVGAAVVGLGSGLLFKQQPLPHIATGIATLASIGGFAKMAAYAFPGSGLLAAAAAITAHAFTVRLVPKYAQRGAQYAAAAAATLTAVITVQRGWSALSSPVRAAMPAWSADLDVYHAMVAAHSTRATTVLVPATLLLAAASWVMLPRTWRSDGVIIGFALATILVPGAWATSWTTGIALCLLVSLLLGYFGLYLTATRETWVCIGSAFAVGAYAVGIAMARPGGMATALFVIAIGGALIGAHGLRSAAIPAAAPEPPGLLGRRPVNLRVAEAGWGAAALAFPGAVAATTAAVAPPHQPNATAVLAASFVALAGALTGAAMSQVARRRKSALIAGGAALGSILVAIAASRTDGVSRYDIGVAFLLLISAIMLCIPAFAGPLADLQTRRYLSLDANEFAAAAVTAAAIAALSRVGALVVGGSVPVVMATLVLLLAILTRSMPTAWRRGPVAGATLIGSVVALAMGVASVNAAVAVIRANRPVWDVTLSGWARTVDGFASAAAKSPTTPVTLLLLAAAAATVLSRRNIRIAVVITVGFVALVAPVSLHTGWWGPGIFSGLTATATGLIAARTKDRGSSMVAATVATVLFADTIATSLVSASNTAAVLIASAAINATVCWTAARTVRLASFPSDGAATISAQRSATTAHLLLIGGGALSGAILTLGAGGATLAAAAGAHQPLILTCALVGLFAALALVAAGRTELEPFLLHATVALSAGGLTVALIAIRLPTYIGVYAAFAALLAVLAELVRASKRSRPPIERWLSRRSVVVAAAGPATFVAIASVAPTLFAALAGPYHWITSVWSGAPADSRGELGKLGGLTHKPLDIVTAIVMTTTLTLGAIGFRGSRSAVVGRAAAVITPGVAGTLLMWPFVLDWPWPGGPVFALIVGSISGLAIALTPEPTNETDTAVAAARKLVLVICVVASLAGLTGGLATRPTTALGLAIATGTGLIAALRGRLLASRVAGWIVTAAAAEGLALVLSVIAGVSVPGSAFAVGGVAATFLLLGALLPRLRAATSTEAVTVEASAYAGGVMGLVLAIRSPLHLAIFLAAWGAALGVAAARAQRPHLYRSILLWTASAHELAAWCLFVSVTTSNVPPEVYTLGVATVAMLTGWMELRWNPDLSSWVTYGVALAAALGPSLAITIAADHATMRDLLLLAGAAVVTALGALRRQLAPSIIGGIALLGTLGNNIARYSPTGSLVVLMAIVAAVLISIGANYEKRRRRLERMRAVFNRMQ